MLLTAHTEQRRAPPCVWVFTDVVRSDIYSILSSAEANVTAVSVTADVWISDKSPDAQ